MLIKSTDIVAVMRFLMSGVYGLYFINNTLFSASGSIAVFVFGLFVKQAVQEHAAVKQYWQANAFLATLLMFFVLSMTVTVMMFSDRWLAMFIGIGAIIIARFPSLVTGFSLISKMNVKRAITVKEQLLLNSTGTCGALAIALAFMLPETLDYW